MKEILFLPPSDKELDDAIEYYIDQLPGPGVQFLKELMLPEPFIRLIILI